MIEAISIGLFGIALVFLLLAAGIAFFAIAFTLMALADMILGKAPLWDLVKHAWVVAGLGGGFAALLIVFSYCIGRLA